ncbi:hypothetical protein PF010_g20635 [Phytophthora fragariae]|uniref:Uncharacterized protein n=1 Tax=Phytophthora fragariae TaxID=53985 RepID=A0A6G0N7V7_9STRA|nr:hypothetical protein PF010_g20635 [Phytophthora fragariae]KAE9196607.1 hypothetical protein PF004_g20083 [Phytophthora fragariae]
MNVYGQSNFDMYANPVVSDNQDKVLYDVLATFKDGSTMHNYTLIDGIAYSIMSDNSARPSVNCLDSEAGKLPAINSIVAALNDAVAVSSESIDCSSGGLFKITVNGIELALCALGSSGFTLFNADMDVTVELMKNHFDIQIPSTDMSSQCVKTASSSAVTSFGKSVLTGQPISNDARMLKAAFDFSFRGSSCSCSSKLRPCIFIHGMGVEEELPHNLDNFTEYWGDHLIRHAPCCSSMKFAHLNTVNNTWTSAKQQQKVCSRSLAVSDTSRDGVITDTIVVTHSMGNLMLAGALANGECSLDASSTWVGLAGPMKGSMASDFVQESCAGDTNIVWEKIGNVTGRCPASTALKSLAYENGSHVSEEMNAAYAAAQEVYRTNIHALMCSKWYSGIVSKYQAEFWALGTMVPHKSHKNDGIVEFESCSVGFPKSEFGDSWRDRFYKTKLNHYDMEFLSGDAILNGEKMPVKWFECLL